MANTRGLHITAARGTGWQILGVTYYSSKGEGMANIRGLHITAARGTGWQILGGCILQQQGGRDGKY